MRVFVLGTGRCGSLTFAKACAHISNFTSGHETHAGRPADLGYPDQHIEVDPRLARCLMPLVKQYPDAFYVHLIREREACIRSLSNWGPSHQFARWAFDLTADKLTQDESRVVAAAMYDHLNDVVRRNAPVSMTMHTERLASEWDIFCERIRAVGDAVSAKRELGVKHNRTKEEFNVWNPECTRKVLGVHR